MNAKNNCRRGKQAERDLAKYLTRLGIPAENTCVRGKAYADVVVTSGDYVGMRVEVKAVAGWHPCSPALLAALQKAAKQGTHVVAWRCARGKWAFSRLSTSDIVMTTNEPQFVMALARAASDPVVGS